MSPETIDRMSAATKARWQDPEYRKRVLASRAKVWADPMKRAAMLLNRGGSRKPHSEATKARMREKALLRCADPAYRAKLVEWAKSQWTPERREAQRAALNAGHTRKKAAKIKAPEPVDPKIQARAKRNADKAQAYLRDKGFK